MGVGQPRRGRGAAQQRLGRVMSGWLGARLPVQLCGAMALAAAQACGPTIRSQPDELLAQHEGLRRLRASLQELRRACGAGRARACLSLGFLIRRSSNVKLRGSARALAEHQAGVDRILRGEEQASGATPSTTPLSAFERACELGLEAACDRVRLETSSGELSRPRLLPSPERTARLHYPPGLINLAVEGSVTVEIFVGLDGKPKIVEIPDSSPIGLFDVEAIKAAAQRHFEPRAASPSSTGWFALPMTFCMGGLPKSERNWSVADCRR